MELVTVHYKGGARWEGSFANKAMAEAFERSVQRSPVVAVVDVQEWRMQTCSDCRFTSPYVDNFVTLTVRADEAGQAVGTPGEQVTICAGRPGACMDRWVEPWMFEELWADYCPA